MTKPLALLSILTVLSGTSALSRGAAQPVVSPRSADPARVARVRAAMRPLGREARLGPWRVLTDVAGAELAGLDAVAGHLPETFTARFGLAAAPGDGQIVAIFSSDTRYRAFMEAEGISMPAAGGHTDIGLAAFTVGRDRLETRVVFVHAVTRLLSRVALGERPPAWLDEGLAADLAWCRVEPDGRLQTDTLDARDESRRSGASPAPVRSGPRASVEAWLERARLGRTLPLAAILARDSRLFENTSARSDAATESAMLVRWCLAEPARAEKFKEFLRGVSPRGAADDQALAASLGLDAATLSKRFFEWVKTR